ncbi:MAG: hypothetical protein NC201_07905 [Prevotella sp.]|nr:hypothetical protein [Bacteroides sp.]MCM1367152.1 hypothetical protein [Prevotella sp.]
MKQLLDTARDAWTSLHAFREKRTRCKNFTFGRQWGDVKRLSDGRKITEEASWLDQGRMPVCNNLIRPLVKSIVGRWRFDKNDSDDCRQNDARTFEEFLISGMAVQRIDPEQGEILNVSPERVFFHRFSQADASDCTFIGMLHDMHPSEVVSRFVPQSPADFEKLAAHLCDCGNDSWYGAVPSIPCAAAKTDFFNPDTNGTWRVIETWKLEHIPFVRLHDPLRGEYSEAEWTEQTMTRLYDFNAKRRKMHKEQIRWMLDLRQTWHCVWLAVDGTVLADCYADRHPFVVSLYPMVDGEVHSLVEDVIDQQKSVNNLVMLLEDVLRASAKGVVLFPADQLPRGMSWQDVRKIWSQPGGIIPFRRTSKNIMPYQLNNSGSLAGAGELLETQMRMFNEITGTNASSRGAASTAKGAEMMTRELEQASVSIYDLLASFEEFVARRNHLLINKKQNYEDK